MDGDRGEGESDGCYVEIESEDETLLGRDGPILIEEEVSEGVDDRSVVIVFVGFDDVGMGADDGVGSGVDESVSSFDLGDAGSGGIFDAPVREDDDEVAGGFFGGDCWDDGL